MQELLNAIRRELQHREDALNDVLRTGVKDWSEYQAVVGELRGLHYARRAMDDFEDRAKRAGQFE